MFQFSQSASPFAVACCSSRAVLQTLTFKVNVLGEGMPSEGMLLKAKLAECINEWKVDHEKPYGIREADELQLRGHTTIHCCCTCW